MPLVQDRSLDPFTSSPARYQCTTDVPLTSPGVKIQLKFTEYVNTHVWTLNIHLYLSYECQRMPHVCKYIHETESNIGVNGCKSVTCHSCLGPIFIIFSIRALKRTRSYYAIWTIISSIYIFHAIYF